MAIDYVEAQAAFRRFKSALTRAQNRKDWEKVIAVADGFEAFFSAPGRAMPDDWARWDMARRRARFELERARW